MKEEYRNFSAAAAMGAAVSSGGGGVSTSTRVHEANQATLPLPHSKERFLGMICFCFCLFGFGMIVAVLADCVVDLWWCGILGCVSLVRREFLWGGVAGAFGEGMMHPVDTLKTRIQSQAILSVTRNQKSVLQMLRTVWTADGLRGIYRGITPGLTGSLATGATYFGFIESTKKWIDQTHPSLGGHGSHFISGAIGDALGSFIYVPCEVIKQRMQVQGTSTTWSVVTNNAASSNQIPGMRMYTYYTGMFHAGHSIWKEQGAKGLYAGYWSTLARDLPFAGLMVTFYEGFKNLNDYGKKQWLSNSDYDASSTMEGLVIGGVAGGLSAYATTPLDVIKTRLQVQGSTLSLGAAMKYHSSFPPLSSSGSRYNGWFDAIQRTWRIEGIRGFFLGSIPRILWYVPASALTFMAVEFLRENFKEEHEKGDLQQVAST
ncbi:Mitochondrial magnesium exporter 1-like protein [Drosera capensis]